MGGAIAFWSEKEEGFGGNVLWRFGIIRFTTKKGQVYSPVPMEARCYPELNHNKQDSRLKRKCR
jgi:hypothetical protein